MNIISIYRSIYRIITFFLTSWINNRIILNLLYYLIKIIILYNKIIPPALLFNIIIINKPNRFDNLIQVKLSTYFQPWLRNFILCNNLSENFSHRPRKMKKIKRLLRQNLFNRRKKKKKKKKNKKRKTRHSTAQPRFRARHANRKTSTREITPRGYDHEILSAFSAPLLTFFRARFNVWNCATYDSLSLFFIAHPPWNYEIRISEKKFRLEENFISCKYFSPFFARFIISIELGLSKFKNPSFLLILCSMEMEFVCFLIS